MKRNNRWKSTLTQFAYEHRTLDSQLGKIRESAVELGKLLDKMGSEKKDKKEK